MQGIKSTDTFAMLRQYIDQECGIYISADKSYLFESRLIAIMAEKQCTSCDALCQKAKNDATGILKESIIDALTTNETLWFRDDRPWKVIEDVILSKFKEDLESGRKREINIWSAGCSSGQEPYSIAMLLDKNLKGSLSPNVNMGKFNIRATDISPSALYLAMSGRYNEIMMSRGLSADYKDRYFKESGNMWEVNPEIKLLVKYEKFNLQDNFISLGKFDLILCRNVAIYFKDEVKEDLLHRFGRALNPDGFFIIGSSESVSKSVTSFERKAHEGIIYYQKKEA